MSEKIYYHGSNSKFTTFDKSKIKENKLGLCFNFTDDYSMAYQYGDNILKVHLDLNNPITTDVMKSKWTYEQDELLAKKLGLPPIPKEEFEKYPETFAEVYEIFKMKPEFIEVLEELGYDGISFPEEHHFGVFEPEQIHIIQNEELNEKLEELNDSIYATNSGYDILNWMKNKPRELRIIYDDSINEYFFGDAFNYIHQDILEEAYYQGFYPDMLSSSEARDKVDNYEVTLFAFYPNEGRKLDIEKSSDGYTRKYVYDFGVIYAHEETPLEDCPLYSLLGEPIKKENVFECKTDFKKLNTILEGFLKDYEEIATIIKDKNGYNVIENGEVLLDNSYPSLKRMLYDISKNLEE